MFVGVFFGPTDIGSEIHSTVKVFSVIGFIYQLVFVNYGIITYKMQNSWLV